MAGGWPFCLTGRHFLVFSCFEHCSVPPTEAAALSTTAVHFLHKSPPIAAKYKHTIRAVACLLEARRQRGRGRWWCVGSGGGRNSLDPSRSLTQVTKQWWHLFSHPLSFSRSRPMPTCKQSSTYSYGGGRSREGERERDWLLCATLFACPRIEAARKSFLFNDYGGLSIHPIPRHLS